MKTSNSPKQGKPSRSTNIIDNKLSQARNLEKKLSQQLATSLSDEEKSSKLRIQLCELFSDILLSDTLIGYNQDITGRMWRSCFYGRIGELRSKIGREKGKHRKLCKSLEMENRKSQASQQELKNRKERIEKLEKSLKMFLSEAIVLYQFLIDKYHDMIISVVPPDSEKSPSFPRDKDGTVPTLFKLYIHLGDLQRYLSSYTAAESSYTSATLLAPAKGNPYNQLAVVAQLKDAGGTHPLPAISLYWYCRSLLANDSFDTSRSNIERLFALNKEWVDKYVDVPKNSHSDPDKLNIETSRKTKSQSSREFLALFVEVHGYLFRMIQKPETHSDSKQDLCVQMMEKLNLLKTKFHKLLSESAFSDALLLKLVCILSFSLWNSLDHTLNSKQNVSAHEPLPTKSKECHAQVVFLSYTFLLQCGTTLSILSRQSLEKGLAKKNAPIKVIRLFTPFLVLFEFVSSLKQHPGLNEILKNAAYKAQYSAEYNAFAEARAEFSASLEQFVSITSDSDLITLLDDAKDDGQMSVEQMPHDYKLLIGYAPFTPFIKFTAESEFITRDQAASVLGLTKSLSQGSVSLHRPSSQGSKSSCSKTSLTSTGIGGLNPEVEVKLKLMRFIANFSMDDVEYLDTIIPKFDGDEDKFNTQIDFVQNEEKSQSENLDDMNDLDKEMDAVVYKPSLSGGPLLVPNSFFKSAVASDEHAANDRPEHDLDANQGGDRLYIKNSDIKDSTNTSAELNVYQSKNIHDMIRLDMEIEKTNASNTVKQALIKNRYEPDFISGTSRSKLQDYLPSKTQSQLLSKLNQEGTDMEKNVSLSSVRPPPGFVNINDKSLNLNPFTEGNRNGTDVNLASNPITQPPVLSQPYQQKHTVSPLNHVLPFLETNNPFVMSPFVKPLHKEPMSLLPNTHSNFQRDGDESPLYHHQNYISGPNSTMIESNGIISTPLEINSKLSNLNQMSNPNSGLFSPGTLSANFMEKPSMIPSPFNSNEKLSSLNPFLHDVLNEDALSKNNLDNGGCYLENVQNSTNKGKCSQRFSISQNPFS